MAAEKVLIVEDNALNVELATDILSAAGYCVLHAGSAEEAIALARAERPRLILMDVGLPGVDGLAATRMLRREPATRAIPIVALTAHAMRGDEEKARSAGCAGYITKPINTRAFPQAVAGFLYAPVAPPWND